MTNENTLVIRDIASLDLWSQHLRNIMWSRDLPAVKFQLPEFSCEQNLIFSSLASRFQKACGCESGGFFMSVTVVTMVVYYFVSGNHLSNINFANVLSFVGITVFAALSGKLLGLLWARWRMLRLATSVHNMIIRVSQGTITTELI